MNIVLSMICGREAAHIETCLRAFAQAFDSLALVFALGNQEPDETEAIARRVCAELGKRIEVEAYRNAPGEPSTWPHVDDFGAARQQSFRLAVGMGADWIFWADADDVACPKTDITELRAIAASGEADAYGFDYDVVGTGKRPIRERLYRSELVRSGAASWQGCVHENIVGPRVMAKPAPVWRHEPHASKPTSKDRNLRLLRHSLNGASVRAFYVHQEHAIRGEWVAAKAWGDVALAMPDLPAPFRYEIALNNVRHGPRSDAETWAAKAFAWFPACREAIAYLALLRMEEGRFADALTLSERMTHIAAPAPEVRPWCYEERWYAWAEYDLLARLLRLNGKDGEEAERAMRKQRPATISLIHATRGRHNKALACRERWLNAASDPAAIETIWCVDEDDRESVTIAKQFRHVVVPAGGGCVRAWNAGAERAEGKLIIQLSDDWLPSPGWDRALLAEIGDLDRPAAVAISDGHRRDDLLCMAILTRARWEQQGREIFSAEYRSVFSDNEFSHRAWRDGVVIDARSRLTFEHMHPAFGRGEMDATYAASNSAERYAEGRETFERRNPDALAAA
jgi:hypothetical protein